MNQNTNPGSSSASDSSQNPDLTSDPESSSRSNSNSNPDTNSDSSSSTTTNSSDSSGSGSNSTSSSDGHSDSSSNHNPNSDNDTDSDRGFDGDDDSEGETESEDRYQEIARTIASAQKRNIRHDAAEVAKSDMPFENGDEMQAYILALRNALALGEYPAGFGLNEEYESVESYKTGRSSKPLIIPLPYEVWFSRIVVWCKALDLLKRLPISKAAVVST